MEHGTRHSKELTRPTISNNHQFLNFVKKNSKQAQSQKDSILSPLKIEFPRSGSVFAGEVKHFDLAKMTDSFARAPHRQIGGEHVSAKKVAALLDKKNKEIRQSMNKEKQSMSDMHYNYSKFRSMEYQHRSNQDKPDKAPRVHTRKQKPQESHGDSKNQQVKLPQVKRSIEEIITIQNENEEGKVVKINIGSTELSNFKKRAHSLFPPGARNERAEPKRDISLYKKRKYDNQLGIEIKSINQYLIDNLNQYENGLEIRKQIYNMVSSNDGKKKKIDEIRQKNEPKLHQSSTVTEQEEDQFLSHKYVSTDSVFATPSLSNFKNKFSALSLYDEEESPSLSPQRRSELIHFKTKQAQKSIILKKERKNHKVVHCQDRQLTVYDQKIAAYRDFLFVLNLAHRKIDAVQLKDAGTLKNEEKYKYYVGPGNNNLLIKSLMKRRFWWVPEEDPKKANFVWTQLKVAAVLQSQRNSTEKVLETKLDWLLPSPKKKKADKIGAERQGQKFNFKAPLPSERDRLLTQYDRHLYQNFEESVAYQSRDRWADFTTRFKFFESAGLIPQRQGRSQERMHNHLQHNYFIGNKKALFYNLKRYYQLTYRDVFDVIPLTYHLKMGSKDPVYDEFVKKFKKFQMQKLRQYRKNIDKKDRLRNVWIIKPGELSNRGNGIAVFDQLYEINAILKRRQKHLDGREKTYIVQKYIQRPLLYKGRKFDIRHFMMISRLHGMMRAYWFGQGYIRTSSYAYDIEDIGDELIHLTNDAIQKNCTFYGKHEEGNKLSYQDFQKYVDGKFGEGKCSMAEHVYPRMKEIATDAVKATYMELDPGSLEHNFQVFGLDFMIDQDFKVWLIEVNTNPCLEISSKSLNRIIPTVLQHSFRLSLDAIFPPPTHYPNSQKYLAPDNPLGRLSCELIFDEARDGQQLRDLFTDSAQIDYGGELGEDNETYENQGKEIDLPADIN